MDSDNVDNAEAVSVDFIQSWSAGLPLLQLFAPPAVVFRLMHRRILPILTPAQEMLEVRLLTIRKGQMDAFRAQALAGFEKQMVGHCRTFSPDLCRVLGEAQLELVVRQSMSAARRFGITHRGPVRLFTEMVFLFGSDFPNDPQYPWAGEILASGLNWPAIFILRRPPTSELKAYSK